MRSFALVSLAISGCLGGGGTPAPATAKLGPEIDHATAESDAKGLVDEVYGNIGRGKPDNLIPLLAPPLVVYGPRKLDVAANRADALLALGKVVDPRKAAQVISGSLTVAPAPGGRSAWAIDVVQVAGKPMAITAVMSNADDLWLVDAAAIAQTPKAAEVKAELAKDAVVPPGMATGPKSDARAQGAIERFQKGLADQAQWRADLESTDDAAMIGPVAGEVARGGKAVKAMLAKRAAANTREIAVGEIVASVTPDNQLAWVTAPVTRASDDEGVTPLRVFAIYRNAKGTWKLTALHEALALDEPGAGAAYRKIAPPVPAKAAPPPKDEPAPTTVATKKKPAKTEKVAKADKDDIEVDEPAPAKKKPPAKKVAATTDDDADAAPPPRKVKKPPPAKKVAAKTDDDDGADDAPPPPKKVKKPPPKKVAAKTDDDTEDAPPPKTGAGTHWNKNKKRRKKPGADDDTAAAASDDGDTDEPVKKKPAAKKKKPAADDDTDDGGDDDDVKVIDE